MPIEKIRGGFRYGDTGKLYWGNGARQKAAKQGRAIELSKLREKGRLVERGNKVIEVKGSSGRRAYERTV